jgi:hypothetical protein
MNHNLEKKLQFISETDSTLYSWCINELGDNEKNHKNKLIPYRFSTFFQVNSLRLVRTVGSRQRYSDSGESKESNSKVVILGNLYPSARTKADFYQTSYLMFGTDRVIESISLSLERLDDDSEPESCNLWGSPSYKSEIDFREFTEPDHISVSIFLRREQFDALVRMVESGSVGTAQLILGQVDGFYSPWSPSISTSSIKVLTEYHEVEGATNLDKPLPILGRVGEFSLSFSSKLLDPQEKIQVNESVDTDQELESYPSNSKDDNQVDESINAIKSLKKPLWWILFALVLLLLK